MQVTQPPGLTIQLYPHQLTSIYRMELMENQQCIEHNGKIRETILGINADPTGTGKTLSMIGLICRDKLKWDIDTPHIAETISYEAGGMVKNISVKRYTKLHPTLILVSPSILNQWVNELEHSDLNVETVTTNRDVDSVKPNDHDVILVTTKMYNSLISSHTNHIWKRFIFDDPGHTRVTGMRTIHSKFTWLVTSTPNAINQYHYNCRGSMMKDIIGDGYLDFTTQFEYLIIKNQQDLIDQSIQLPPLKHTKYICFQPIVKVIDGLVSGHIKTLIEAGNISEAIMTMGGSTTRNLVDLVKAKKQEELVVLEGKPKSEDKQRHIKAQISELDERYTTMLQGSCNICMDTITNPVLEPHCHNIFCGKCLLNWLQSKSNCPICRNDIKLDQLIYVDNTPSPSTSPMVARARTKTEQIVSIIQSIPEGKVIIFSAYDESFGPICKTLTDNDISFVNVAGSSIKRHTDINNFKIGSSRVLFLNSRANCAGIDLPETTDIILYHDMSTSTYDQIIGRANRIGRVVPLHIHQLT